MDMPKNSCMWTMEEDLCEILKFNLEIEGYEVDTAFSAEEALKMDIASYQLLLLDVMMGEISGFKMASILKKEEKTADIPIIFLTAKDTENDMLTGFNLGADDYISKPFSIRQVVARVKAVLRRTSDKEKVPENECLKYETLSLDTKRIKASVDGQEVPLTKKEFEILKLLLENKGTCSRARDPFPDMERRSICARPHHRCKHHPPAQKDRAIRQKHRDAARLRILL